MSSGTEIGGEAVAAGSTQGAEEQIDVRLEVRAKANFALQQHGYPIVTELTLENPEGGELMEGLAVRLKSDWNFIAPKEWTVDRLGPGEELPLPHHEIKLNGEMLSGLEEATECGVTVTVMSGERTVAEEKKVVKVLAHNEWGGTGHIPEMLAAFSLPNDPAVDRILKQAGDILDAGGIEGGLDGYQSRERERVWQTVNAVYVAVARLGLSYSAPPASFETDGQKIRTPSGIVSGGIATCLDTTMLMSACLEQAGLNPIVMLTKDHAFAGAFLQPEQFSSVVVEEAELIRKRDKLFEIAVIETTCLAQSQAPSFNEAVDAARVLLKAGNDPDFHCAVDVRHARTFGIKPLGKPRTDVEAEIPESSVPGSELALDKPPEMPDFDVESATEQPQDSDGRLERWQRKLLDLTLRNPLLNHKPGSGLRLICPDPALLEDKLDQGRKIKISAVPELSEDLISGDDIKPKGDDVYFEAARDALERNTLLVDLKKEELDKRAVQLYRKSQSSLQESGSNTLFLALGYLTWKKSRKAKRNRAPLILLPVTLERKTVRGGIRLTGHDDEARFNTTLLQMLREDFALDIKGLDDELPTDEHGVDVRKVWAHVRREIKDAEGFEVAEEVSLAHFSFAKYLMWKDLADRIEELKGSKLVRHLLETPGESYRSDIEFVDARELDDSYEPKELMTTLPADSSQLAAIAAADKGKDFIIEGPPGTGKSQTISNLIAHMLGQGKNVLFVSEKIAALEVVHRRLKATGVGRFCLELHSNKANKKEVLAYLNACWDAASDREPQEWDAEARNLATLRGRLNDLVKALHTKRGNGLSAQHAFGVRIKGSELAKKVRLEWRDAEIHSAEDLEAMRATARNLGVLAGTIGDFSGLPKWMRLVGAAEWTPRWEEDLVDSANGLGVAAKDLAESRNALLEELKAGTADDPGGLASLLRITELVETGSKLSGRKEEFLDKATSGQLGFAVEPGAEGLLSLLNTALDRLDGISAARELLSCEYSADAWRRLDGERIQALWLDASMKWAPFAFFSKRKIVKLMVEGGAKGSPDPGKDASLLAEIRRLAEEIDDLAKSDPRLGSVPGWNGIDSDVGALRSANEAAQSTRETHVQLLLGAEEIRSEAERILKSASSSGDAAALAGSIAEGALEHSRAMDDFGKAHSRFSESVKSFESAAAADLGEHAPGDGSFLAWIGELASALSGDRSGLNDWCRWQRERRQAESSGQGALVEAVEAGAIEPGEAEEAFEAAYCSWFSNFLFETDETLRRFNRTEHESVMRQFQSADDGFFDTTARAVAARLSAGIPKKDSAKRGSEWGILLRETQKKMRHKPVRQLIREIPEPLSRLAPCMMMSPLSVAQYLPADQALFDVIIFDEASQVTVWDAVGAIARGKQVIVAGDPKQMPPTNFFSRAEEPDDDVDYEGDLESILDEMIAAGIPRCRLNLHYRSRRESLIAFSNSRYYNEELVTFPAPVHPDEGVKFVKVDGHYSRGRARTNRAEADAIVAEIVRRLTHDSAEVRNRTIGVVTFNSQQQALIQDLLDKARGEHPEIEEFFSDELEEPVFVKNLEAVQGDERDVIMFSITYGPDETGHMTMNFGPMNRDGGERRLNVAITRARYEKIVFSTVSADSIDASRTSYDAIKDLKDYLRYAKEGRGVLPALDSGSLGRTESPFETYVMEELRRAGWKVDTQIGVSSYRIDLAVIHPDKPGAYLAGVECDGAMYHSSATARERDKIRQKMLEGLGWTLFRVWSTDWWIDQASAFNTLNAELKDHLEKDRKKRDAEKPSVPARIDREEDAVPAKEVDAQEEAEYESDAPEPEPEPDGSDVHSYTVSSLAESSLASLADRFYDGGYDSELSAAIEQVVQDEGPVHEDVLFRRVAQAHGFRRLGGKIRRRLAELAEGVSRVTRESGGAFYWPKGAGPDAEVPARVDGRTGELSDVGYICREELRRIDEVFGLQRDPERIARKVGLRRVTKGALERISEALESHEG